MRTSAAPIAIFTASAPNDGVSVRLWRLVISDEDCGGNHDGERQQPSEHERGPLSHAALRSEHENEGGEGDRLKRDHQADEDEVKGHVAHPV